MENLTKKQVQQRVLQNGTPLAFDKFSWDEKTNTFSSAECGLVVDFSDQSHCTFKTGWDCTFKTGLKCTFDTGSHCTFKTESACTFKTESHCTFKTGWDCTFETGSACNFKTRSDCTFETGSACTFDTGLNCTFETGSACTFDTGSHCTFETGSDCTFDTGLNCTFETGSDCTFKTRSDCTFDTGLNCVIVNRNVFEVIQPREGDVIQICPGDIAGHLVNGMYHGKPHIIADGILSEIVSQRGNVFRVINHGETKQSYLIKAGDVYSHGATLKEARDGLIYKISDRDTGKYDGMTLDSVVTFSEAVAMYRTITGACAEGCQYFVERNKDKQKGKYTIAEIIELTAGQYNSNMLVDFFKKGQSHA